MKEDEKNKHNAVLSQDELRKMRRLSLLKLGAMGIFAAIIVIFGSIAWFTMNKENSASGMGVRVKAGSYELRFSGNNVGALSYTAGTPVNGVTPYTSTDIYGKVTPTSDYAYNLPDGAENVSGYYDTSGDSNSIILRLSDASPSDPTKDTGLHPGSEGELIFGVVPRKTGELTVKLSFNLLGYTAVQSETPPFNVSSLTRIPSEVPTFTGEGEPTAEHQKVIDTVTAQIQAEKYLNTHIMFFKGEKSVNDNVTTWNYDTNNAFVSDDIVTNGFFEITIDAVANTQEEVRVKWVWPNTLKQMVFKSGENEATSVTQNEHVLAEIRQYACEHYTTLLKEISDTSLMMSHDDETGNYSFNQTAALANLEALSRGYNKADSDIGKNINYMLLVLTAE